MATTIDKPEYAQRRRLAWIILVTAFVAAVVIVVSIPLGVNAFIQQARQPLIVAAQANEGTLGIDYADDASSAIRAADPSLDIDSQINLTTTPRDTGLLLFYGIGHSIVIILAGTFTQVVQRYLNWTERSRGAVVLRRVCGVLVILGGVYLVYSAR